jgi:hypothetical protein
MNYREFVKENFHKLGDMPAKDKMKKLGEMWRKSGHSTKKPTGGAVVGGMARKRGGSFAEGSGLIGSLFPPAALLGLGMQKKHTKRGSGVAGGGFLSDALGSIGLGVPKKHAKRGSGVAGGGFLSDALGSIGLGVPEGGDVSGGGIFSGLLGSIGLGMPEQTLHKHFKKMSMLENKLHTTGKLTPGEHHKLKVYHHLHGAGFFDKIFSGIKKGVGAVVDNLDTIKKVVPEVIKHAPEALKMAKSVMGKGVAGGKMKAKRGKGGSLASSILEMVL